MIAHLNNSLLCPWSSSQPESTQLSIIHTLHRSHPPEQEAEAAFPLAQGFAPKVLDGQLNKWGSVPTQWSTSGQMGASPVPKWPPRGMAAALPQLSWWHRTLASAKLQWAAQRGAQTPCTWSSTRPSQGLLPLTSRNSGEMRSQ